MLDKAVWGKRVSTDGLLALFKTLDSRWPELDFGTGHDRSNSWQTLLPVDVWLVLTYIVLRALMEHKAQPPIALFFFLRGPRVRDKDFTPLVCMSATCGFYKLKHQSKRPSRLASALVGEPFVRRPAEVKQTPNSLINGNSHSIVYRTIVYGSYWKCHPAVHQDFFPKCACGWQDWKGYCSS